MISDAIKDYLSKNEAISLYAPKLSLNSYLLKTDAVSDYLSKNEAVSVYAPLSSLNSYLLKSDAIKDYLSKDEAVSLYATLSSLNTVANSVNTISTNTQNISATSTLNTISKSSQFKLSNSNTFSITDDSGPFVQVTKLLVTNTGINVQCPLSMNTYQLSGIPIPLNNDQCPNKLYVDTSITNLNINNYLTSASAVSTYATLTSLGSTNLNVANLLNTTQNLTE